MNKFLDGNNFLSQAKSDTFEIREPKEKQKNYDYFNDYWEWI